MRGTMLILRPDEPVPEVKQYARPVTLEELQSAVGGYIEEIPGFRSIGYGGTVMNCVALANENGKQKKLPLNEQATWAWEMALRRRGASLRMPGTDNASDHLVGTVIVLFGDREFSESL